MTRYLRIILLCLIAGAILASYEVARSAVEAIFTERHGAKALPTAWLLIALAVVPVVAFYNHFSARARLEGVLVVAAISTVLLLLGLKAAVERELPGAAYALYIWRDVYIVVLLEIFWTYANTILKSETAPWIFSLFCAVGSLGSIAGAELLKQALKGSTPLDALLWVVPLLLLAALGGGALHWLRRMDGVGPVPMPKKKLESLAGLKVLRESPYLIHLLALVVTIQLVVTLVDYEFNRIYLETYPDASLRAKATAQVYQYIGWGALAMQVLTGPILSVLKMPKPLVALPAVVGATVVWLALAPALAAAAAAKIVGKVFDYSLFRASKEMLYLPLDYREKTQGKAMVDMLGYRVAKGGASLALLGIVAVGLAAAVTWIATGLVGAWVVLAVTLAKRYRARVEAPSVKGGQP